MDRIYEVGLFKPFEDKKAINRYQEYNPHKDITFTHRISSIGLGNFFMTTHLPGYSIGFWENTGDKRWYWSYDDDQYIYLNGFSEEELVTLWAKMGVRNETQS